MSIVPVPHECNRSAARTNVTCEHRSEASAHKRRNDHTLTNWKKPDCSRATHQGCLNKSPPPRMNTGKEGAVRSPIEGTNAAHYRICQRNFKFEITTRGSATRSRPTYHRSKTRMYANAFKHASVVRGLGCASSSYSYHTLLPARTREV